MLKFVYACVTEQHDLRLVALAAVICVFACFATANLFLRAQGAVERRRLTWLTIAAAVFGSGVWATHFVAELAYRPGVPVGYDFTLTALSAVIAVGMTWLGMAVALNRRPLALGGAIIGAAVGAMHYVGMAALRVPAALHWNVPYVIVSLVIGMVFAAAAAQVLSLGPRLRNRVAAATLLVVAICGLHFTAMAAVVLELDPTIVMSDQVMAPELLAIAVTAVTVLIITLGLSGAIVDGRMTRQATREAQRLRHNQEHLARAQRIARTGSVERDLRTGWIEWSDEMYRVFGLERRTKPLGREESLALLHPEDRDQYDRMVTAAQNGVGGAPVELRVIRPDGVRCWVRHESEVFHDEDGTPARWIGTFTDVTEAREAEERQRELQAALRTAKDEAEAAARAVQAANQDLERRVEERTAELRAMQSELLKNERLSTLGQVTATVAHELRNPLGAMSNTVFALDEIAHKRTIDLDRPLARIRRSIARCNQIISELLDFTRVPDLVRQSVPLDDWLGAMLDGERMPEGIVLERRLAAPTAVVALDPDRLRNALINVIENAVQAIAGNSVDPRSGRITVATSAAEKLTISIEDSGPGIPPDILSKVFEPLFSTKGFGTGLGLPTVRQIVQQHGGSIRIDSPKGRGAIVEIVLPLADRDRIAA
jgi:PAS domain S-box-containing protein